MNFLGFNHYQLLNHHTFPIIPTFQKTKKEFLYEPSFFENAVYQFNISQIFQWIEIIESKSDINLSKDLYFLFWKGKHQEFIKFLKKGKGIVIQTFGNTNFKFLKKICMGCDDFPFFLNEYFIMVYGINFLRYKTPTFNFTYSLYKEDNYIGIKQEFNDCVDLSIFLNDCSREDFITIFFQIILSLEVAQFHLLFTHYDFHIENIVVEKIKSPFSIHYRNKEYVFQNYKIKIIDFSFSTVTISSNTVLSNCYTQNLYANGYYPFFTPGTDMFRILCEIFYKFHRQKESYIKDFCLSIFQKFYKISFEKIYYFLPLLKSNYFNCSVLPIIYLNPLELFEFLEEEYKNEIPFEKKTFEKKPLLYQTKFKNIFSIESIHKNFQHNPLDKIYSSNERSKTLPFRVPKSPYPIFLVEDFHEIKNFFERYSFFLDWFSISEENTKYHSFFRILYCLKEFLYFINNPCFKFTQRDMELIQNYHRQLKDIL